MAIVKPLDWISWWDARARMPEIWELWAYSSDHASTAMMNALRSGQVHCRSGDPYDLRGFDPAPLNAVISGLRRLTFGSDEVIAEYEIAETKTVTFGGDWLRTSRQHTSTAVRCAKIPRPELVWSEFRDYLIRFELPAGAVPNKTRADARRNQTSGDKAPHSGRPARPFWDDIHPRIDDWLDLHGDPIPGDGKQAELEDLTDGWLQEIGQENVGEATIRRHVQQRIARCRSKKESGGS